MPWTFYNASGQKLSAFAPATVPVFGRVARTTGDVTTSSTTLVDLTGATITFTTGAFPINYGFVQGMYVDVVPTDITVNIIIDSTLELGSIGWSARMHTALVGHNMSFSGQSVALSAASHTTKMQWFVSANTATCLGSSTRTYIFWAHEIR